MRSVRTGSGRDQRRDAKRLNAGGMVTHAVNLQLDLSWEQNLKASKSCNSINPFKRNNENQITYHQISYSTSQYR